MHTVLGLAVTPVSTHSKQEKAKMKVVATNAFVEGGDVRKEPEDLAFYSDDERNEEQCQHKEKSANVLLALVVLDA